MLPCFSVMPSGCPQPSPQYTQVSQAITMPGTEHLRATPRSTVLVHGAAQVSDTISQVQASGWLCDILNMDTFQPALPVSIGKTCPQQLVKKCKESLSQFLGLPGIPSPAWELSGGTQPSLGGPSGWSPSLRPVQSQLPKS